MVTQYSQRDPEWADEPLGTSSITIGEAGCLITSVASIISDAMGFDIDPSTFNGWLINNDGYIDNNLFVFSSVEKFGLQLVHYVDCKTIPAPIKKIEQAIDDGNYVVLMVDSTPGRDIQSHWVRLVDAEEWIIMDPWQRPGGELVSLSKYFAAGWNAARAIFKVVIYRKATIEDERRFGVWESEHQSILSVRNINKSPKHQYTDKTIPEEYREAWIAMRPVDDDYVEVELESDAITNIGKEPKTLRKDTMTYRVYDWAKDKDWFTTPEICNEMEGITSGTMAKVLESLVNVTFVMERRPIENPKNPGPKYEYRVRREAKG